MGFKQLCAQQVTTLPYVISRSITELFDRNHWLPHTERECLTPAWLIWVLVKQAFAVLMMDS